MMNIEQLQNSSESFVLNELTCPMLYAMTLKGDTVNWKEELVSNIPDRTLLIIPVTDSEYIISALSNPEKDIEIARIVLHQVVKANDGIKIDGFSNALIYDSEAESFSDIDLMSYDKDLIEKYVDNNVILN